MLRRAYALASTSNLIINPVNSVSTIAAPTSAPSTTGFTNILPASTGYAASFTGTTANGSNVITSVSSTSGLVVGQPIVENAAASNPYPANIPLGATITAINSGASTITISKNCTGAGSGITIKTWTEKCDLIGGVAGCFGGNFIGAGPTTGNSVTPPTAQNAGTTPYAVEFVTDAANISTAAATIMWKVFQNGATPYSFRVAIDDVYQTSNPIAYDATGRFGTIQFSTAGSHKVRIEFPSGIVLMQLWIINGATVSKPTRTYTINAGFYSDSFGLNGASSSWQMRGIAQQLGLRMGWLMDHLSVGGTGYTTDGGSNYTFANTFRTRDVLVKSYDVMCFWGSVNDAAASSGTMQAAALATWQAARANNPTALMLMFGVPTTVNLSASTATTLETGLAAAFAQFADSRSRYIPVTTDPAGAWLNAGNVGTYINADGTHPVDDTGTRYLGQLMAARAAVVLP